MLKNQAHRSKFGIFGSSANRKIIEFSRFEVSYMRPQLFRPGNNRYTPGNIECRPSIERPYACDHFYVFGLDFGCLLGNIHSLRVPMLPLCFKVLNLIILKGICRHSGSMMTQKECNLPSIHLFPATNVSIDIYRSQALDYAMFR